MRFIAKVPKLKLAYDPRHFIISGFDLDFTWVFDAIGRSGYSAAVSIEYIDNRDREIQSDITLLKKTLETRYNLS